MGSARRVSKIDFFIVIGFLDSRDVGFRSKIQKNAKDSNGPMYAERLPDGQNVCL
jgi:hypothetical protein